MKKFMTWAMIALLLGFVTSCKDDDPEEEEEPEVITNLVLALTSTAGTVEFTFEDLDGDGGNAPTITSGTLTANTTYTGAVTLTNKSVTPEEDITAEIQEEDKEHQFFYYSGGNADITFAYADMDDDGNPVGLATTITTGAASTGTMTIVLRHEPNKSGSGVSGGDITNAGGETDIEVTFDVDIQ